MPSLFDMADRIGHLEHLLDRLEVEDDEQAGKELEAYLVLEEEDLAGKIDNYVWAYQEQMALADARKAEAKRLQDGARWAQNRADQLKRRAIIVSEILGRNKLTGQTREIIVSSGGFSVSVLDEDGLGLEFKELIPAQLVVRKKLISDHIKATGEVPEGVETREIKRVRFK